MFFLIGLLKFIIILLANIGIGYLITSAFHCYFFCEKQKYLFGYKIPFTPGLIIRKKKWLIKKLTELVEQYLDYAIDEDDRNNYLARFEDKLFETMHDSINQFFSNKKIPGFMKNLLANWSEKLAKTLVKKIAREFIPFLIFNMDIKGKIDSLNEKIDISIIRSYFKEYVYKYVLYFSYACFGLLGIYNAILYAVLRLF
ncbi:MAG TPA: hypothetical protein PL063_00650 [Candidatus Cloacimonadota bacterium]|mgnify:FL=1|jgi:uncharacterized membrane protein YheB (UPF0754 family)|nr:hypothetical protein [Candidatus Cloacimonadales bacterium]HPY95700.1 hypothetical protein [Candidatus Cloacimonadota bacterium]HQB40372.1 hypothetical protein [Candidatus Cloacimonadota bacterium]